MDPQRYTQVPRATLWLLEGDDFVVPGDASSDDATTPMPAVAVGSFYISKDPITNAELQAFHAGFVRSTGSAGDDDPAVGVSLGDAQAYCEWYARLAKKPFRLPTDVEWEFAWHHGTRQRWFVSRVREWTASGRPAFRGGEERSETGFRIVRSL